MCTVQLEVQDQKDFLLHEVHSTFLITNLDWPKAQGGRDQ
jgi:hypothetical protein